MKYEYIILDFGNVLAKPTTGNYLITPKFKELVNIDLIDNRLLITTLNKYHDIIEKQMNKEEEEYNAFYEFYSSVLQEIYPNYTEDIAHAIAYNFTYKQDKYIFYDNIKNELENLSKKYKLILLTDNFPSIDRILKERKIYKYFDKIYISSQYGTIKKEGLLFNYPIEEYNIKNNALFIDDSIENLDVAIEKGLDVLLLDREDKIICNKYKKINNLENI